MVSTTDKMAKIQSIFIDSKKKGLSISDLNELNNCLINNDTEYISIAYEAAAMGIAIKSIQKTASLQIWDEFYQKYGKKHANQIHVGMGWAIAELELDICSYIDEFEPFLKYRVIDGYAYYHGKFKRRQAVRLQEIPKNLDILSIRAYNQGLGRCFWYNAQGEVDKLIRLINIFPKERHFDMWRGIGVAIAYVGSIELSDLKTIIHHSDKYIEAFKCGLSIAIQTKQKAKAISESSEKICESVFRLSA